MYGSASGLIGEEQNKFASKTRVWTSLKGNITGAGTTSISHGKEEPTDTLLTASMLAIEPVSHYLPSSTQACVVVLAPPLFSSTDIPRPAGGKVVVVLIRSEGQEPNLLNYDRVFGVSAMSAALIVSKREPRIAVKTVRGDYKEPVLGSPYGKSVISHTQHYCFLCLHRPGVNMSFLSQELTTNLSALLFGKSCIWTAMTQPVLTLCRMLGNIANAVYDFTLGEYEKSLTIVNTGFSA